MPFSPLISKIRCHNPNRSGSKNANRNYLFYIATREGVDLSPSDDINNLMENQKVLESELNDEYVYKEADNMKYLQYIAFRPRSHGLFGNINTDNLGELTNRVMELTKSGRNIYRGIVSLSERDAEALGFIDKKDWENYLKQVLPDVAKELGVSSTDFTWVAAFHAEKTHPHIHFELWDNKDKVHSPFIHISKQHACRNLLSNAMFDEGYENMIKEVLKDERKEIYNIRNQSRTEITDEVKDIMAYFSSSNTDTPILPDRISINEV
jgi:hypothetical protein